MSSLAVSSGVYVLSEIVFLFTKHKIAGAIGMWLSGIHIIKKLVQNILT